MNRDARIFVAGHNGLVGSALCRRLRAEGSTNVLTVERRDLDLRDRPSVERWFQTNRPDYVFMAAGTVGGIRANMERPAEFIFDNLAMRLAVIHAAHLNPVRRTLLLGSSCAYPRNCAQPIKEELLFTGPVEPTNEPFAAAVLAATVMAEAYRTQYGTDIISVFPANLYGPHDNFDPGSGHVIPSLISRFHDARVRGDRTVTLWGTGTARRGFLHVDDLADACLFLMDHYQGEGPINVGTDEEVAIGDLALAVRDVVHPDAAVSFDSAGPDGCPRRVLDASKVRQLGWRHSIALPEGIRHTYQWFLQATAKPR